MSTPDIKPSSASLTESSPVPGAFFITGGTMRPGAPSYVERTADRDLLEALRRSEFCYVLDTRQMGKSSLMARVANRLRENCAVATIDLTAFGQSVSLHEWYDAQVSALGRQFGLEGEIEDFIDQHESLGPVDRWVKVIRDVIVEKIGKPIIIFVDEIDYVRSLPFPTDEYFAAIRHFYNARAFDPKLDWLTFCLLGVSTPNDLIRDEEVTPFNLGHRIVITDFSQRDAEPVLLPGLDGDGDVARQKLNRVFFWTDGHPYLTQRLCEAVKIGSGSRSLDSVDRACKNLFLMPGALEATDSNLRFTASRLLIPGSEADVLDLYGKVWRKETVFDDGRQPFAETLKLSGIAKTVNGKLRVRNEIYRHVFDQRWIDENMPDQEKRRLEEVARRVRRRALLIGLSVLVGLCALALAVYFGARSRHLQQETNQLHELTIKLSSAVSDALSKGNEAERQTRLANASAQQEALLEKQALQAKEDADAQAARARRAEAAATTQASEARTAEAEAKTAQESAESANKKLKLANQQLAEEKARADSLQRAALLATNAEMLRQTQPALTETAALLAIEAGGLEQNPQTSNELRSFRILGKTAAQFEFPGSGAPKIVALSPNHRYLAVVTSGPPKQICDVDLTSYKAECVGMDDTVYYLAASDAGALTILGEDSGRDEWQRGNPLTGTKFVALASIPRSISPLLIRSSILSEGGCEYAEGELSGSAVTIRNLCSEAPSRVFRKKHASRHIPLGFDFYGRYLATISTSTQEGWVTVSLWDARQDVPIQEFPVPNSCKPPTEDGRRILADQISLISNDADFDTDFPASLWSGLPSPYPTPSADLSVLYCKGRENARENTKDQVVYLPKLGTRFNAQVLSFQDVASRFAISQNGRLVARETAAGVEIVQRGRQEPLYLTGVENVSGLDFIGKSDMLAVTQRIGLQRMVRVFSFSGQSRLVAFEQYRFIPPPNSQIFPNTDQIGLISQNSRNLRVRFIFPDTHDGSVLTSSAVPGDGLFSVTPDGNYVVAGAVNTESSQVYSLTDAGQPSLRTTIPGLPEAFSADGSVLVTASASSGHSSFSTQSDNWVSPIRGAQSVLAVSANGQLIAFSTDQCGASLNAASTTCIEVYDRMTTNTVIKIPATGSSTGVLGKPAASFSQDNLFIHVVMGQFAETWDLTKSDKMPAWSQSLPSLPDTVSFTPDGSRAVIVLKRFGPDMFWDTQNRHISLLETALPINAVISDNGRYVASADIPNGIRIFDLPAGKQIPAPVQTHTTQGTTALAFNHASSHLAGLTRGRLTLISLDGHLLTHDVAPTSKLLGFTADDSRLGVLTNASIQWYRTDTLDEIGKPFVLPVASGSLLLSRNGLWLATGAGRPGTSVQIVRLRQPANSFALGPSTVVPTALAVAPGTNLRIAVGSHDGLVHLTTALQNSSQLPVLTHGSPVTSLSWSSDGVYIAAASDSQVSVFDAEHSTRRALCSSDDRIAGIAFSFDRSLMFATRQGDVNVIKPLELNNSCSPTTRRKTAPINAVYSSPSGDSIVTVSSDSLNLWDSHDWRLRKDIGAKIQGGVKFSRDGSLFAALTNARTLEIWEAAQGNQASVINTDYDIVAFAFSSDGTVLATASRNLIELWDIDPAAEATSHLISSIPSQSISNVVFDPAADDLVIGSSLGIGFPTPWRNKRMIHELCDRILRPTKLSKAEQTTYMFGGTYVDYCAETK